MNKPKRYVIGLDPGAKSTGVAVWDATSSGILSYAGILPIARTRDHETTSFLGKILGDSKWVAAVEKPYNSHGPIWAYAHLLRVLTFLARDRAFARKKPFRKPIIYTPLPQIWRRELGLPTRGEYCKDYACEYAELILGWDRQPESASDEGEAVCIAGWAAQRAFDDDKWTL